MNFSTQTSTVLMAQQHMYMEMPSQAQSRRMAYASAFFQAGDVENACGDWQKMGYNKGGSCHKVGSETVNGRSTVKYEATNAGGEVGHFWLHSAAAVDILTAHLVRSEEHTSELQPHFN